MAMKGDQARERLLEEYDQLEDAIENLAADRIWVLADWLADNVPNEGAGRPKTETRVSISLVELAERRGRTVQHLRLLRRTAEQTRPDRLDGVAVRSYAQALTKSGGDLQAANERLRSRGVRLRDQSGRMMSETALLDEIGRRTPDERKPLVDALAEDPRTRLHMTGAVDRHHQAARHQFESEERAREHGYDDDRKDAIVQARIGRVLAEARWAVERAARHWRHDRDNLTEQAYADVREDIAEEKVRIDKVFDAMLGTNIDQELAEILGKEGDQ